VVCALFSPSLILLIFINSKICSKLGIAGAQPTLVTTIAAAADPISMPSQVIIFK
jgi:hypothetical protein